MQEPLFSFGMVADIQYGDFETRGAYRFREVPEKLRAIIDGFNQRDLAFVVQLGDIVEGNGEKTQGELDLILSILAKSRHRLVHLVGNHCLSAGFESLLKKLDLRAPYYDFRTTDFVLSRSTEWARASSRQKIPPNIGRQHAFLPNTHGRANGAE
jgi:hypothetical protein